MNYRIPMTTTLVALGLACAPAFASGPANPSISPSANTPAVTAAPDASGQVVATVRKVYFFNQLDRNHNGLLSRAELPKDMVDLRRDFVRADFDGNGQLSPEEYVLYSRGLAPQYIGVYHAYTYVYASGTNHAGRIDIGR